MGQNTTISVAAATFTQLTDANVTSITFQNKSGYPVFVQGTADATPPTDLVGAVRYNPGQGERNVLLADLFPGISAARVWAFSESGVQVFVSHA